MEKLIKSYLDLRNETKEKLKTYVVDMSIPLEKRWDMFIISGLGEIKNTIIKEWNVSIMEVESFPQSETILITDLLIEIQTYKDTMDNNFVFNEDLFKEYCLKHFIKGFINDW